MKLLRRLRAMYPLTPAIFAGKKLALPKNAVTNRVRESADTVLTGAQVKRSIDWRNFHQVIGNLFRQEQYQSAKTADVDHVPGDP